MNKKNISERFIIAAEKNTKEKAYWFARLADAPAMNHFPYGLNRGIANKFDMASLPFTLVKSENKEFFSKLLELTKGSDYTLNLFLVAGIILLLDKYTYSGGRDIIIGAPIYRQENDGEFVNTVLALRNRIEDNMTVRGLLLQVRQTISEAVENQNYPLEMVVENLYPDDVEKLPHLFDVVVLLENIHEKKYLQNIRCNTIFSFKKNEGGIEGTVEYNSLLFSESQIKRIIGHLKNLLSNVLFHIDWPLTEIEILSAEEKKQLIFDFNDTSSLYPETMTINQWFEDQVEKSPEKIAVSSPIDLSDVYDLLETVNITAAAVEKIKTCRFKKNPFISRAKVELPGGKEHISLVKTHCHNSVILSHNTVELITLFDGKKNLEDIYKQVKNLKFILHSMSKIDLLEVSFQFKDMPEIFSIDNFEEMVALVQSLYKNHLIELTVVDTVEAISGIGDWRKNESLFNLNEVLLKDKKITPAQVLLIGDTPGIPTTGLLYLASYLRRNNITTCCQFYDPNQDYPAMKKNIEELLEKIQPSVVAISLKWFLYIARVLDICKIIKEYSGKNGLDIKIVVGGNTASYYWEEIIKYDCIDYLVRGDGEEPLLKISRGEKNIPNCIYKQNGEITVNSITYVQDETNSKDIYLSNLDELLLANHNSLLGTFFIYTHKGCAMNCLYCGGCNLAQQKTFNRKKVFRRNPAEVRKDISEAKKYASTFQFDFDLPDDNLIEYCRQIWDGFDLSGHFCIFATLNYPSSALVELVSKTFKYVYWDFDICTFSERHRKQLVSLGLVKPQPSDNDILNFMTLCEQFPNIEVRLNSITGLPYFKQEDIEPGEKLLAKIVNTYACFGELHWARLHAQPGTAIVENPKKYQMYSNISTFEDFLKISRENFNTESQYNTFEDLIYPYIYFEDDQLNSKITNFYLEGNKKVEQYTKDKQRGLIVSNTLTYRQLNERAGQLAAILEVRGAKPGNIIGLMVDRSINIIVGILGILKAGCAYLPIDPEFPSGRINYMLKDSKASQLVTERHLFEENHNIINWNGEKVLLEEITNFQKNSTPSFTSISSYHLDFFNLAYVIYTSGTTGNPKGVVLHQKNLVNYVNWFSQKAGITGQDKSILTTSFAFDLGYTSLYTALLNGCELHILPRETYLLAERFLNYIKQKEITYLKVTPSLFSVIVNAPGFSENICKSLRLAAVGGESINVKDIEKAHTICRHLKIMNHYGPTETTIGCISTIIDFDKFEQYKSHPVIGKPIANAAIYILGKDLNLLPIGIPGELCISGAGVGMGYLNQPELTAEKFISSTLLRFFASSLPGFSLYRTGDLARWLPDGTIEFLGRSDSQVKVRGYRIELAEIESRLKKHPLVNEALAIIKEATPTGEKSGDSIDKEEKYICAYIVPKENFPVPQAATTEKTAERKKIVTFQELGIKENFVERVGGNRKKIAIEFNDRSLTFEILDRYAGRLAHLIRQKYDDRYKLSKGERTRYKRQMLLAGWGQASQEKLKSTTVFVAGAGGGASPTVTQLALAGFGTIKICDFDTVELSNLNRQFLHDDERLGMNKALSAQMTVNKINPHVKVIPYTQKLTRENVFELVGDSAIIFDMFDGPADKFVLSECAVIKQIPHVIISMTDINAYAAVLHSPHTPCYHCLFDKIKFETIVSGMTHYIENYSKNPLPVVSTSLFISTGVIVNEALKILLGFEKPAYNRFFYFNQRGPAGDLVFTPGYKAMTYLFSDHFIRMCKEQGFDWDLGWRGKFLEEFNIEPAPDCPVCGHNGVGKRKALEEQMKMAFPAISIKEEKREEENQQTIALLLKQDISLALGAVGAMKAGKIFVPLDPTAGIDELVSILEDSESRIIVTDENHMGTAKKLCDKVNKNIAIINIDHIAEMDKEDKKTSIVELPSGSHAGQVAYMIYSLSSDRNLEEQNSKMKELCKAFFYGDGYTFENRKQRGDKDSLTGELREYLQKKLPAYMIPSYFIPLEKIPLTPNGKVDRKKLPDLLLSKSDKYQPPQGIVEEKLVEIWSEVLAVEKGQIGIDANFFSLGGHSLSATIMISKIHKELNVRIPLNDLFKAPDIKNIAIYIKTAMEDKFNAISPVKTKNYYALSSAQKRLYFIHQLEPRNTTYNILQIHELERVDIVKLEVTFKKLIKRHDNLRTSFQIIEETGPVQKIHDEVEFKIEHHYYQHSLDGEECNRLIRNFVRPFDLSKAPVMRVGLIKTGEENSLLLVDMHHIISDAISHRVLLEDFLALSDGQELPPLKLQYKDYAEWQNSPMQKNIIDKQKEYWLREFNGPLSMLNLPLDYPRKEVQDFEGESLRFTLGEEDTAALKKMALQESSTLYFLLLSIYYILLSKISGQEDIIIGTSVAGRKHADLEKIIGMFINTVALRNHPKIEKTFVEFVGEVTSRTIEAFEYQDFQFDDLVNLLGVKKLANRNPLFDVSFAFQQYDEERVKIPGNEFNSSSHREPRENYRYESKTSRFDMSLYGINTGDTLSLKFEYSTKLFKKEKIERFINYFNEIVSQIMENKYIQLGAIHISHELLVTRKDFLQDTQSFSEF